MSARIKLCYLCTHPIQYQSPLLRRIAEEDVIELKVFYQSDCSVKGYFDRGFGTAVKWDIPLTEGINHEFLPPLIGLADRVSFLWPLSRGLFSRLRIEKPEVLWVFGYARPYNIYVVIRALLTGYKVILRDDPNAVTTKRGGPKELIKKALVSLFSMSGVYLLGIGSLNINYFAALGMRREQIFLAPFSIDNESFEKRSSLSNEARAALLKALEIPTHAQIVLFAAKLIKRKRASDLLRAFVLTQHDRKDHPADEDPHLVIIGDGECYQEIVKEVSELGARNVHLLGFKNQSELPAFYAISTVFVLPADNENWGLTINEAMSCGKPVIVSDQVGSGYDLVRNGENGFVFRTGDIDDLARTLREALAGDTCAMGRRSKEIISKWSYNEDIDALKSALKSMLS